MKSLFITSVWPEPQSSAAGVRDQALLEFLKTESRGNPVKLVSPSKKNEAYGKVDPIFQPEQWLPNDSTVERRMKDFCPDVVFFDRLIMEEQFGWRIKRTCPKAIRILDTQDLHFLRISRSEGIRSGKSVEEVSRLQIPWNEKLLFRELASIYRSDLTLVVSDFEEKLLKETFRVPPHLVFRSGFYYPPHEDSWVSYSEKKDLVILGNFRHEPNRDGVFWFVREIWPLLQKQLPGVSVHLYGAYPSKEIMALHRPDEGFEVHGHLGELSQGLKRARVNLAPLRFGAGIKGKIAEGWRNGLPCVTTSIGSEGMTLDQSFGGRVANSAEKFAAGVVELYQKKNLWEEAVRIGQNWLMRYALREKEFLSLAAQIQNLFARGGNQSWVSRMLWEQNFRSTEYFSRWIEEKNRSGAFSHHSMR